jgi:polar amino acid transport system substrate-binding protein
VHRVRFLVAAAALTGVAAAAGCGAGGDNSSIRGATTGPVTAVPHGVLDLVETGALTVGSDVSYPPQEFYDLTTHQPVGFDLELGAEIARRLALHLKVVNQSFDGIIPALNAKKFDIVISAMTINDTRKQSVSFVPYLIAGESFVVSQTSGYRPKTLTDLCGHTVAVQTGTAEADAIRTVACPGQAAPHVQQYTSDTEASAQIEKGAVDAYFTDSPVAAYDVRLKPSLVISGPVLESAPEGIAVRRGDTAMLDAVARAFAAVEQDGTYRALLLKWILTEGDITRAG